jgi:hypothetical protein
MNGIAAGLRLWVRITDFIAGGIIVGTFLLVYWLDRPDKLHAIKLVARFNQFERI